MTRVDSCQSAERRGRLSRFPLLAHSGTLAALILALGVPAWAHRLDEYLQAARLGIASERITLRLDLTPGVEVVPQVLPLLHPDKEGRTSPRHAQGYARRVLRDLSLELDGKRLTPKLVDIAVPAQADMEAGEGTIRLSAAAGIARLAPGVHELVFRNDHLPKISVYLANALVPEDRAIHITRQSRDELQKQERIGFEMEAPDARRSKVP